MDIQHLNVKLFVERPDGVDLKMFLPVFHAWIQEQAGDELLIDVADYRHVPAGPGVVLIGHEANYSMDNGEGRLGLLYNRKAPFEGDARTTILQAIHAALRACRRLERHPTLRDSLTFDGREMLLALNDRLLFPNTEEAFRAFKTELDQVLDTLYGPGACKVSHPSRTDPRERLTVHVAASRPSSIDTLLGACESLVHA